jgi:hypothetical protein
MTQAREQRLELENLELRARVRALEERIEASRMKCPVCGVDVTK